MDSHGGESLSTGAHGGTHIHVDALTNDSDFTRIQQFVTDRLNATESSGDSNNIIQEAELNR